MQVAAGSRTRVGGPVPKQWRDLGGRSVAGRATQVFADHPAVNQLVLVLHPADLPGPLWPRHPAARIVAGSDTRAASVRAGLAAVEGTADIVLIHDAARPLVSPLLIDRVFRGLQIARAAGITVAIVAGDEDNLKITTEADFARALRLMGGKMDVRVGNGFDVHRFEPGDHVWLCGVKIPFIHGLNGHSDADVGLHAVTDAIYGALAMGDIGQHFPPSDPQWKGAASHIFLTHAVDLARDMGFTLTHVDCTLICELPKIGPHAAAMRAEMARILGIDPTRVSVKATTSERLGFTGRGEGIAAMATATLVKS